MNTTTVRSLKKGDIFQLKEGGTHYTRGDYFPELKKYNVTRYDDAGSQGRMVKGSTVVFTDSTF